MGSWVYESPVPLVIGSLGSLGPFVCGSLDLGP